MMHRYIFNEPNKYKQQADPVLSNQAFPFSIQHPIYSIHNLGQLTDVLVWAATGLEHSSFYLEQTIYREVLEVHHLYLESSDLCLAQALLELDFSYSRISIVGWTSCRNWVKTGDRLLPEPINSCNR